MIFSMFHCSHSLSNRNAKCHVKKSARRFFWRGFGSGETETDEFGVKELPERKENSPQDSSASNSPGNQELDQSCMFHSASGIDVNDLDNVDFIPSTSNLLVKKLCRVYFEDNKVVIKMAIKGRSPTLRHVSRTHRVALHWLCDRINLNPENPNQTH